MKAVLLALALLLATSAMPAFQRPGPAAIDRQLLPSGSAWAVEPGERLPDPAMEARARSITAELRCLVCQNESVDDSNAGLAHDIRVLVRDRLKEGDSDTAARQAVVDRYGQFVLLRPLVQPATYVLWFGPLALLVVGLAGSMLWVRRRPVSASAPLTETERRRLDAMLRDQDA